MRCRRFSGSESCVVNVDIETVISVENRECTRDRAFSNDKEDDSDLSSVKEAGPTCCADEATEATKVDECSFPQEKSKTIKFAARKMMVGAVCDHVCIQVSLRRR